MVMHRSPAIKAAEYKIIAEREREDVIKRYTWNSQNIFVAVIQFVNKNRNMSKIMAFS